MKKNYSPKKIIFDNYWLVVLFCLFTATQSVSAQSTANYTFNSIATGSLVTDRNGNTINMATGTTSLIGANRNAAVSSLTSIGFDFYLLSNRFTEFSVNDDGILQLGGTVVGANLYAISTGTASLPKLSAFNADMRTGTTSGKVHYKVVGTAPNRVLVVEFLNMQLFNTTAAAGTSTWQMRLYETSGMIEYVYGAMNVSNISSSNRAPSIGLYTGSSSGSFVSYLYAGGTFSTGGSYVVNPNVSATGNITNLHSTSDGSRRLLRFSPPGISDHASITSLASPTGINFTSVSATGLTVNWTASSPTTGIQKYAVYSSTDNVTFTYVNSVSVGTNNLSITGLSSGTTYYFKVYPLSEGALGTSLNGASYCIPSPSSVDGTGITNVVFSSVSNSTAAETNNYGNYSSQIGTGVRGTNVPISITTNTTFLFFNLTYKVKIWVDWNNDSDFSDAGEEVFSGSVTSNTLAGTIAIPLTASLGNHRVRIGAVYKNYTPTPCYTGSNGAYEDYTLNVTSPAGCTSAPTITTGPPNRTITAGSNTTFTSTIANAPDSYVWEVSTDGGVNYTTITNGGVYSTSTTSTLTISGATGSMTGFLYRIKATNACGSVTSSPGTLTVTSSYCTPSSSTNTTFINGLASTGTLLNTVSNSSAGFTSGGYDNNSSIVIAKQIPGGAINFDIDVSGTNTSFVEMYVDWNSNGTFDTPSEEVYVAGAAIFDTTFGFVVPISQLPGNYRMRLRTRSFTDSSSITPCGTGYSTGETEDFTISIVSDCASKISSVINGSNCGTGTVTLGAVSDGGATEFRWYSAETGGTLLGTTSTGTWTTPSISTTTTYYVSSYNGSCESLIRVAVKAIINPISNITFSPAVPVICGSGTILSLSATGDTTVDDLFTEDFESGSFGNFTLNTIYATNGAEPFAVRTSSYLPTNTVAFKPAINSGGAGTTNNKFAFTTSDINLDGSSGTSNTTTLNTALETTNAINTTGFSDLTLTFDHYYSDYSATNDSVIIEVNTGSGWTTFTTYTTDQGTPGAFASITLDFTPYINQSNFKFRFRYVAKWNDGYALDNVRLYGTRPLSTTFDWGVNTGDMYSDSNATIPYVSHTLLSTVYVKPDVTLSSIWTYSVSTTLLNGCAINKTISVPNNTKIWNGSVNSDYTNAANWFPTGTPTSSNCVEIFTTSPQPYPVISGTSYAKTLTLKQSGTTLNINSGQTLTVTDKVTVASGANLAIANTGSLVQITDGITNSGNISMTRTSRNMFRYDYVYHGSPVAGDIFSQIPSTYDYKYKFVTNGTANGQWNTLTSTTVGEGFIARVKNIPPYATTPTTIDFTYTGVPNNGTINMTVDSYDTSSNVSGNTKLFANPYPSAIDAGAFISSNPILGAAIYLWTAHTAFSGTGLYTMADYIVWTRLGGTIASPGGLTSNGKIAAGQGFFAQTFGDGTVSFNNTMRVAGNNNSFFKVNNVSDEPEMNRIWLNLTHDLLFHQILIGYAPGASTGYDNLYDGLSFTTGEMDLYSIVGDKLLAVQGRPIPFDQNDIVDLGYKVTSPGSYTIAIDHVDGLFNTQDIFLEDKLLNIVHDIKAGPYTFMATAGSFNDRFDIRYTNTPLAVNGPKETNNLNAFISNEKIFINASQNITNIDIYDISGKFIKTYNLKSPDKIFSDVFVFAKGVYITRVKLENGAVSIQKLIN